MQQLRQNLQQLNHWWQSASGADYLAAELTLLADMIASWHGKEILLLASAEFAELSNINSGEHLMRVDPSNMMPNDLPEPLDIVMLPHLLSYCDDADNWIEALWQRLPATGKLVITGYSYRSLLGVKRCLASKSVRHLPNELTSYSRLYRLLCKQGFTAESSTRYNNKNAPSFFGGRYCLIVSKRHVTVKHKQPKWQAQSVNMAQQSMARCGENECV